MVYVTKMKKNLKYETLVDCMDMNPDGRMEYREQVVVFRKDGVSHIARIITYVDIKNGKTPKLVSLLTNDFDMFMETVVAIYRRRWQIECTLCVPWIRKGRKRKKHLASLLKQGAL